MTPDEELRNIEPGDRVRRRDCHGTEGTVIETEMDHGHLDVFVKWDISDWTVHRTQSWIFADQLEAL
jgi:hypothetical protein